MDLNDFRVVATVLVTIAFLAVTWWAFSPRRKKQFDEAAQLPFADDDQEPQDDPSSSTESNDNTSAPRTGDDQ